jgi:LacI family transcriptional regulator
MSAKRRSNKTSSSQSQPRAATDDPAAGTRIPRPPSLVAQVEKILRQALAQGQFVDKLPTEVELAEQLGVSRETVRRATEVLQNEGLLVKFRRRGTFLHRRDVALPEHPAADALAYLQADYRLPKGRLEPVTRDIAGLMLQGALEAANEQGFDLVVRRARPERLVSTFRSLRADHACQGLILASFGDVKALRKLTGSGLAGVVLDHAADLAGFGSVRDDSFSAARMAVEHLASLGHRRIALANWHQSDLNPWRLRGYREGLRQCGLARRRRWELSAELSPPGAEQTADELLAISPRPSAVYCFNNSLAAMLIERLRKRHVRVPEDITVMGGGGEHQPEITCHQADWHGMGRQAVEVLLRTLHGDAKPEHVLAPHQLHPGRTAGPPPR